MDAAHEFHEAAWEAWRTGGKRPDPSNLTYDDMDAMQHWDMPGLPSESHSDIIAEMVKRWKETTPCPTCGHRTPE